MRWDCDLRGGSRCLLRRDQSEGASESNQRGPRRLRTINECGCLGRVQSTRINESSEPNAVPASAYSTVYYKQSECLALAGPAVTWTVTELVEWMRMPIETFGNEEVVESSLQVSTSRRSINTVLIRREQRHRFESTAVPRDVQDDLLEANHQTRRALNPGMTLESSTRSNCEYRRREGAKRSREREREIERRRRNKTLWS